MMYKSEQLTLDHEARNQQGIYSILRGIDTNLRELHDEFYDYRKESESRMSRMGEEVSNLKREVTDLKITTGVTEHRITELREDVKELRQEVSGLRGELREIAGSFAMMQTRLNWWLVIVGIVIAALQYWKG
ncbi:MAG: hypothetical protein IJR98_05175 [Synergistaceae bacterium]|nr:hypothetical protein [Synergistaceae bacterium]